MTDHEDDDPQLKALRTVWLSMPDEAPPERGLAELMAAARVKAEAMTQPRWWRRIVAVLRRPPVLALATVMVLIGGAVLIGRRADKMESKPEESRDRGGEPALAPPAATPPAGSATPAPVLVPELPPEPANAEVAKPKPAPPPPPGGGKQDSSPPRQHASTPTSHATTVDTPKLEQDPKPKLAPATGANKAADDFERGETEKAPAPTPTTTQGATPAKEPSKPSEPSKPAQPSVSQYFAQARSAAARGDCSAARMLAGRIAKQDAQYYRRVVLTDASIKKCVAAAAE